MTSFLTETSDVISSNSEFRADFNKLTLEELGGRNRNGLDEGAVVRLLESSAILSLSNTDSHKQLAYKIAIYLLNNYAKEYKSIPFVSQLVLTRLGDLPVIRQMTDRKEAEDYFSFFNAKNPTEPLNDGNSRRAVINFPEAIERQAFNQVEVAGEKLDLTDFQRRILAVIRGGENLALSAPPSSGKSYVIHNFIVERLMERADFCAVYIVPTKALVSEVQGKLSVAIRKRPSLGDAVVLTGASTLSSNDFSSVRRKILVLTQERLQEMLAAKVLSLWVDLLVVDEAQQVANNDRGIVIEDAVGELVREQEKMQKIFIAPYVKNLQRFADIFGLPKSPEMRQTLNSPVGQNFILVTFKKLKGESYVRSASVLVKELAQDGKATSVSLGQDLMVKGLTGSQYQLKTWVATNMTGKRESTIIYCNRPKDARLVAEELTLTTESDKQLSPQLKEMMDFLRTEVHALYYLADYLPHRIGYHYGTMPQFIRSQVRRLFEAQELTYLACTSTLLEGVNLPARNIVLFNPKKGPLPMDRLTMRNLMGRAGRLSIDYYGKIFCINVDEWPDGEEVLKDEPEEIESSSESELSKNIDNLLAYLRSPQAAANERTEAMATSLLMKQIRFPDQRFLADFRMRHPAIDSQKLADVGTILADTVSKFILDKEIILRNRSVDPRFQDELYRWMRTLNPPPLPPDPGWGFYDGVKPVFEVIARRLLRDDKNTFLYYCVIASEWVDHFSYKRILQKAVDYNLKSERAKHEDVKKTVNRVIEELDDAIENEIRFNYVRGMKCYCDVLSEVRTEKKAKWEFCERLPQLLEAGASDERVLLLIGAGLSRSTAIEIFGSFGGKNAVPKWKSVPDTVKWLKENRGHIEMNVHRFFYEELETLFGKEDQRRPLTY